MQEGEPSPSYPSEIKSVGENESIEIKQTTINLLNISRVVEESNHSSIYIENGYVRYVTGANRIILRPSFVKENTSYSYKLICKSGVNETNTIKFAAIYTDGSTEVLADITKKTQEEFIIKFKTNKLKMLDCIRSSYTNGKTAYIKIEGSMILEEDRTNDINNIDYIPNQEKIHIFPISEPLRGLPNGVKDALEADGIHRKAKQVKLSDLEWVLTRSFENGIYAYRTNIIDKKYSNNIKFLCSSFKYVGTVDAADSMSNYGEGYCASYYQSGISNSYAFYINTKIATLEELQNFLLSENVVIDYELAEEIIEPYTAEQQAVINEIMNTPIYKGTTYLFSTDEIAPTLKATYVKDLDTILNNITTAIIAEGGVE